MITATWSTQLARAIWKSTATISPPRIAAVILANRCQGDGVRYLLLAGMASKDKKFTDKGNSQQHPHVPDFQQSHGGQKNDQTGKGHKNDDKGKTARSPTPMPAAQPQGEQQ